MTASDDAVTVTCQASLGEMRSAVFWLTTHDRAARGAIVAGVVVPLIAVVAGIGTLAFIRHLSPHRHTSMLALFALAVLIAVPSFRLISGLWNVPAKAWRRGQAEGPTTLTVSSKGLDSSNSARREHLDWAQLDGYAVLPNALIFVSSQPFVVPRSTVNSIDFERVCAVAKQYLQPITSFDSRARAASTSYEWS